MPAFVLNWNPTVWSGISDEEWDAFALGEDSGLSVENSWSTGVRTSGIAPGDPVFLLRQGNDRGIIAVGVATSEIYTGPHYNDESAAANYVDFDFQEVATIGGRLPTEVLVARIPEFPWNHLQGSGVRMDDDVYLRVLALWSELAEWAHVSPPPELEPESDDAAQHPTEEGQSAYVEGALSFVVTNRYERSPRNRAACIGYWGSKCFACDFDFEQAYGERGKGYIEVHHVVPLAQLDEATPIDPVSDMRPLCSNCHSAIHRGDLLSPEELRALVVRTRQQP